MPDELADLVKKFTGRRPTVDALHPPQYEVEALECVATAMTCARARERTPANMLAVAQVYATLAVVQELREIQTQLGGFA